MELRSLSTVPPICTWDAFLRLAFSMPTQMPSLWNWLSLHGLCCKLFDEWHCVHSLQEIHREKQIEKETARSWFEVAIWDFKKKFPYKWIAILLILPDQYQWYRKRLRFILLASAILQNCSYSSILCWNQLLLYYCENSSIIACQPYCYTLHFHIYFLTNWEHFSKCNFVKYLGIRTNMAQNYTVLLCISCHSLVHHICFWTF